MKEQEDAQAAIQSMPVASAAGAPGVAVELEAFADSMSWKKIKARSRRPLGLTFMKDGEAPSFSTAVTRPLKSTFERGVRGHGEGTETSLLRCHHVHRDRTSTSSF